MKDIMTYNTLPRFLNQIEIDNIIELANGPRNKVMIELLYACGLRVSELLNLKIRDVNFENRYLRVYGKGSKERLVPIAESSLKMLSAYLKKNGHNEKIFPLSRQRVWQIIKKLQTTKRINPHIFRHSFATHLLNGGADIRVVQELLGHENICTTQIYTHVAMDRLKEVHRKFHPREN